MGRRNGIVVIRREVFRFVTGRLGGPGVVGYPRAMNLVELVRRSLEEDVGGGDVTTLGCVPAEAVGSGRIIAKQDLVVCGHDAATEVFRQLGADYEIVAPDGTRVSRPDVVATVRGPLQAVLTGERLAMNFLMRLCGIATHTAKVVAASGDRVKVVDTRKTTPLHRALERRAVVVGGGGNHRFALYDGVLIKDNHIVAAGGVVPAIQAARAHAHHLLRVQIEVEDLDQLATALDAGADAILLDNMDDATLARAVEATRARPGGNRVVLEASGNMNAERIARIAGLGLDLVSMGGLIHQATWADLSLELDED